VVVVYSMTVVKVVAVFMSTFLRNICINLMETIITSVNHRLLFQDRRVFEARILLLHPHRTIMYQSFNRYFVQYARTPTLR